MQGPATHPASADISNTRALTPDWPTQHSLVSELFQLSSVAQSCPTLCDPMNCSTLGLPVHHQLPEFTQTHVHRVGDAIQPSHPLSAPSPPAPNPSKHQSLFQSVNSLHEVAKHSFQGNPRADLLQNGLVDLLAVQGTLQHLLQHHSSKASVLRRSAFFTVNAHIHT